MVVILANLSNGYQTQGDSRTYYYHHQDSSFTATHQSSYYVGPASQLCYVGYLLFGEYQNGRSHYLVDGRTDDVFY
jgi:hypothetical protein